MSGTTQVAIVGAGPYGLAAAAHLRSANLDLRVFGKAMESWKRHMPVGMLLRSYWEGSHISDPHGDLTLDQYQRALGVLLPRPVRRDDFIEPQWDEGAKRDEMFAFFGAAFRQKTMAEWMHAKKPQFKRVYIFKDDSLEYSKATADYFKARWLALGGKVCGEDSFVGGANLDLRFALICDDLRFLFSGADEFRQPRFCILQGPMPGHDASKSDWLWNTNAPIAARIHG